MYIYYVGALGARYMIFVVHSDEINTELWVKSYLIPSIIVIDSQTL